MECPICYTNAPTYVINCGSTVEHTVCDTCEVTMRMKEPATSEGRILKCPMCRVPEKVPGKRTAFSYEYELSHLYESAQVRAPVAPVRAPVAPVRRNIHQQWANLADQIRDLPQDIQNTYIRMFPQMAPYFEIYHPEPVIDLATSPRRIAAAVERVERQIFPVRAVPPEYHAFCQSGNRETGTCPTRGKTQRKCIHIGCNKFVCRSCRQCLTH